VIKRMVAVVLLAVVATRADAQRISAGAQIAFAEYSEQGASLRFDGGGPSAHVSLGWRRFDVSFSAAHLAFVSTEAGDVAEPFDVTQTDLTLRVRATRLVSVEAGFVDREVKPLLAAQSVATMRVGALMAIPLAAGADVAVRASYLAGSKFSGGGSAPFGVEIGLGVSYAPWWERVRVTGDLEFLRLDRSIASTAGRIPAPIQSSTARLGVMVTY
jgi:hypothetical protein